VDSPTIGRGTFSSVFLPLPEPVNTTLYVILGLADWNVTAAEIRSAWRQAALLYHPDHHSEADQVVATTEMQKLNAAKEVLLDARRRRQYHVTGELPSEV
jgi:curved DNA-binding protein CbpA